VDELEKSAARWREAMLAGTFEDAWRETDLMERPRRMAERRGVFTPQSHHLVWNGEPFRDRRVLVRCEHGLGDTIMFARYFPLLAQSAREVIVQTQPQLLALFMEMPGVTRLLNAWTADPDPPHEVVIECMELAYAFRSTPATLPARVPYLKVERPFVLPNECKADQLRHKVGLLWAASDWDTRRSVPISDLAPLAQIPGVTWYSLQQGARAAETRSAPLPIEPLSRHTQKIEDAAAAMRALDLIITVDTMAAHLAGALARPVWLILRHEADWRWLREGDSSPWYPTMRIFRQPEPGNWRAAIEDVARHLAALVARQRRSPGLPPANSSADCTLAL
jgi:ADP-heptose:LPS heptosyltransferase